MTPSHVWRSGILAPFENALLFNDRDMIGRFLFEDHVVQTMLMNVETCGRRIDGRQALSLIESWLFVQQIPAAVVDEPSAVNLDASRMI